MRASTSRRAAVGALALAAVLALAGDAAAAADPGPISDQATVAVRLTPSGAVSSARLYRQLSSAGGGTVRPTAPVSGQNQLGRDLPVTVRTTYLLNGTEISPAELAGATGALEVRYHVENVTAEPMDVSYRSAEGKTVSARQDVVLPLVAQLSLQVPSTFTGLEAPQSQAGGYGRGDTRLLYSMVLFAPIGAEKQDLSWRAEMHGGAVPDATLQVTSVASKDSQAFSSAQVQYRAAADAGARLVSGAGLLDSSLGQLADGTGRLLAGLNRIADGADRLAAGLDRASDGSSRLAAGFEPRGTSLAAGGRELSDGLATLSAGLERLSGSTGLPEAQASALALKAGVDRIAAGLGSAQDPDSVLGGIARLKASNQQAVAGAGRLGGGLTAVTDGIGQARDEVGEVQAGLADSAGTGGSLEQLEGGVAAARATAGCSADPVCVAVLTQVQAGVAVNRAGAQKAAGALGEVSTGLGQVIAGLGTTGDPQTIRGGLAALSGGLSRSGAGMDQLSAGVREIRAGLSTGSAGKPGISAGLGQLAGGLEQAVTGIGKLADGASAAAAGSDRLADGITRAGSGASQLSSGLGRLAAGGRELSSGAGRLVDGATAVDAGVGQFQDRAIEAITGSVAGPADQSAKKFAVLDAMNTRAATDGLPYGATAGATGQAVYRYQLAGVNQDTRHNAIRGGVAALILAAAAGVGTAFRRQSDAAVTR